MVETPQYDIYKKSSFVIFVQYCVYGTDRLRNYPIFAKKYPIYQNNGQLFTVFAEMNNV
jgi:hypothetical protein